MMKILCIFPLAALLLCAPMLNVHAQSATQQPNSRQVQIPGDLSPAVLKSLLRPYMQLSLSAEQESPLNVLAQDYLRKIQPVMNDVLALRAEMFEIMQDADPDQMRLQAIQSQLQAVANTFKDDYEKVDAQVRELLTPAQRKQLDLLRSRQQNTLQPHISPE